MASGNRGAERAFVRRVNRGMCAGSDDEFWGDFWFPFSPYFAAKRRPGNSMQVNTKETGAHIYTQPIPADRKRSYYTVELNFDNTFVNHEKITSIVRLLPCYQLQAC